jgi:hypothetical protein
MSAGNGKGSLASQDTSNQFEPRFEIGENAHGKTDQSPLSEDEQ